MDTAIESRPSIALTAVKSSQIAAIGHDAATSTMAVKFPDKGDRPGSLYHYANVTEQDFAAFVGAESLGSHFIKHFKNNAEAFPFTRIS